MFCERATGGRTREGIEGEPRAVSPTLAERLIILIENELITDGVSIRRAPDVRIKIFYLFSKRE